MSVSVSAVPFLLIYAVGSGIMSVTGAVISSQMARTSANAKNKMLNKSAEKFHLTDETLEEEIFNKEFPTAIVDKSTLVKTLEEHGAVNIQQSANTISCDCEAFHITFTKKEEEKPYSMVITYNNDHGLNELVDNLGTEYSANAQEISYNKIKERLEKQNLKIEEEEVFDDNTIVLTVNLE